MEKNIRKESFFRSLAPNDRYMIGNLFFLLYDFALTSFVMLYVRKIREKLLRSFK